MDSPTIAADSGSGPGSNDDTPRVKFLCSFSGSILPRPQDGKLRYVGGETRIVSVPRDIGYEELMAKMRELFEGTIVLKYQQPDEDLDALVSVVNDDDVTNMMEEYDKLGSGDGFTKLRIFLFSQSDQDSSMHFGDGDDEKRYVDALNSLNDSPDFRRQPGEYIMGPVDDVLVAEQYFNQMSLDGGHMGSRNVDLPMAQINLRQLNIPHWGSGMVQQQPVTQRYNEMEAPWSPAYYSPRQQPGYLDQRPVSEFPSSPGSSRYQTPYGEFVEEHNRPPLHPQSVYEQQPQYVENVVLVPAGPGGNEKAGFPGNILHTGSVYEGNSICEHCRTAFPRPQVYPDSPWKPGEQPHIGASNNGYHPARSACGECHPNHLLNADGNMHHQYYPIHHSSPRPDEPRTHVSLAGRLPDNYVVENGTAIPVGCDGHHVHAHYVHHDDPCYVQGFPDQVMASGSQVHAPSMEGHGVRYNHPSYAYGGVDNLYQLPHGHTPPLLRNVHNTLQAGPSYDTISPQLANGSVGAGFIRSTLDASPRLQTGLAESALIPPAYDASLVPEYPHSQAPKQVVSTYTLENQPPNTMESPGMINSEISVDHIKPDSSFLIDHKLGLVASSGLDLVNDIDATKPVRLYENGSSGGGKGSNLSRPSSNTAAVTPSGSSQSGSGIMLENGSNTKAGEANGNELPDDQTNGLPESTAVVTEVALPSEDQVEAEVPRVAELGSELNLMSNGDAQDNPDGIDGNVEVEMEPDNDNEKIAKIEPTKAEADAIDRGLQTIRNEDLEEIRELGSGTYGAVYHGKWKGSDVAIKRIKASCFAGKPSERERLIADFWKEALILSSLHHPNVVSFYGVVRDGPDGSLATVTEFMVNGSLKQFLQKKDRTIDRRKRLIIAMDAAFGMEYLHGKNIVHFDLKCENLLVNMRDPHRPVCKIGDLGLSKVKQHTLVSGGVRGTLPWMAPELLSGKSNMVTEKIDVYSFGIVMWELLTGDEPYTDMHCASIIGGIVNNTLRPQIPTWCDPEWRALMESCWASDPAERPSFSEISQRLRTMAAAMNLK